MHVVRLTVKDVDVTAKQVWLVVADAKDKESAGRLAQGYAEDCGWEPVSVDKIVRNTTGFIVLDGEET